MLLPYGFKIAVLCLCVLFAMRAPARPQEITDGSTPTFKTLLNFDRADGYLPGAALVQATDGNLYGTTAGGGTSSSCAFGDLGGCGTIFKINAAGKLTTLHSFDGTDSQAPNGLVQAIGGNFYGTTNTGGTGTNCGGGCGTVFKMTPEGMLTTLHNFDSTDGAYPSGSLVQGRDGDFYGTTANGGADQDLHVGWLSRLRHDFQNYRRGQASGAAQLQRRRWRQP